jgi:hypothetical protein
MPNQKRLTLVKKNKQGSALVFALIILSMMLTVAMSLSTAAVMQKKSASSTQFSIQAYQAADGAAQLALRTINNSLDPVILSIGAAFSFAPCSDPGLVTLNSGFGLNTTLELSFLNSARGQLGCLDSADDVAFIQATARHLDTVRAVELAVVKLNTPIAWWKFDDNAGTTALDSSNNNHDGTLYTPTWTTGKLVGALAFNGSSDYIETPFSPRDDTLLGGNANSGQIFTIESWVNPTNAGSNYRGVWGGFGTFTGMALQYDDSKGGWSAQFGNGVSWNRINFGSFTPGSWTHVVVVFEGSTTGTGHIRGYLNGNLVETEDIPSLAITHESTFSIGRGRPGADNYFHGRIDDVKIFNYALSESDIVSEYNRGMLYCEGSLDANGTTYPGDTEDLSVRTTHHYSPSNTAQKCEFECNSGHDWDPVTGVCDTASCIGSPPANATAWNALTPTHNLAFSYSASDPGVACKFYCNSPFVFWNGTACAVPICTGSLPPANVSVYLGANLTLTQDEPYVYSGTNTDAKCEFTCVSGYVYDGATNTCKTPPPTSVDYLVVAGGGGGGGADYPVNNGGGGGAGGMLADAGLAVTTGTYTVTVGGGGAGGATGVVGSNGGGSSFNGITATGGGGGAPNTGSIEDGIAGGSGGGGRVNDAIGGAGIAGQGNNGGKCNKALAGAGGGGAGAVGGNVVSNGVGAAGGAGLSNSITGTATVYAGGGGGGGDSAAHNGIGGSGGGGAAGVAGTANTGGGGGGKAFSNSAGPGLAGGSGVVIIRYPNTYADAIATTGLFTYSNNGGFKIYKFTSSGSITF